MTATATEVEDEPRSHPARWIAIGLAVVTLALVGVLATRPSAESALAHSPLLGKPAPEIVGTSLDGSTVRLSALRGRYVLVNFFASWCVACTQEHDDLIRFSRSHATTGDAQVLGVLFDDTAGNARKYIARYGGEWPIVTDPHGQVALDFGVRGPPESFLVDPNGYVLTKIVGQVRDSSVDQLINEAQKARQQ